MGLKLSLYITQVTSLVLKELLLHINRALIENNEFVQTILSRKTSFQKVVGILTRILSWKYEKLEAREKAKRFLLNSAKPGEKQIEGLKRKFAVESNDEAVFAETRAFVDPEGLSEHRPFGYSNKTKSEYH